MSNALKSFKNFFLKLLTVIKFFIVFWNSISLHNDGFSLNIQGNSFNINSQGLSIKTEGVIRLNGLYTLIQCDDNYLPSPEDSQAISAISN